MSARPLYVLMHGWGFDAGFWDGVRAGLPADDVQVWDYGYFGPRRMPQSPADRPLVAVGHSHGAMVLLDNPPPAGWAGFVAINGFPRFAAAEDYPAGVRRRLIDQMAKRFDDDPATVLTDFRTRCGTDDPPPGPLQMDDLRAGLLDLRDGDRRAAAAALTGPALALGGGADPIVPPDLLRAGAACFRHAVTEWLPDGGHLLPMLAPDWCVGHVIAFAHSLTGDVV